MEYLLRNNTRNKIYIKNKLERRYESKSFSSPFFILQKAKQSKIKIKTCQRVDPASL
jgi:hypothetical protein